MGRVDTSAAHASRLDDADALRDLRARFAVPDPEVVYFDGNSLARLRIGLSPLTTSFVEVWDGFDRIRRTERR